MPKAGLNDVPSLATRQELQMASWHSTPLSGGPFRALYKSESIQSKTKMQKKNNVLPNMVTYRASPENKKKTWIIHI